MKPLILFVILSIFILHTGNALAEEIVNKNPGFEIVNDGMPEFWSVDRDFPMEADVILDSKKSYSGKHSISIWKEGSSDSPATCMAASKPPGWVQEITEKIPTGKTVHMSAYVSTSKVADHMMGTAGTAGEAFIYVECLDEKGTVLNFHTTQYDNFDLSGNKDWARVDFDMEIPHETNKIKIYCRMSGQGQAWFDMVKMTLKHNS